LAVRVCLMIEARRSHLDAWRAVAAACEEGGSTGFRSDHYRSVMGRSERGSLDAWARWRACRR